jgi:hypothetical protein
MAAFTAAVMVSRKVNFLLLKDRGDKTYNGAFTKTRRMESWPEKISGTLKTD